MRVSYCVLLATALAVQPAVAQQTGIAPSAVYAVATGDMNGDGADDAVLLVEPDDASDEDMGLYFYLRENDYMPLVLHTVAPNMAWGNRMMAGQVPTLTIDERGSVILTSENIAIGRHKWEEKLTIALREGHFLVAGYTYSFYDGLDPDANGGCDVNLLTGKGTRDENGNETAMTLEPERIRAADWGRGIARDVCGFFE